MSVGVQQNRSSKDGTPFDPAALLRRLLTPPPSPEALADLRRHAEEFWAYLESSDETRRLFSAIHTAPPEWTAQVFEALAGEEGAPSEADLRAAEAVLQVNLHDEIAIAKAVRDVLLPGLPCRLQDLGTYFAEIDPVDESWRDQLLAHPAACAGKPYSWLLAERGMTILMIFDATEAVPMLLDRLISQEQLPAGVPVRLGGQDAPIDLGTIPAPLVREEIRHLAQCGTHAASLLGSWVIEAAQSLPRLFRGWVAYPEGPGIRLFPDREAASEPPSQEELVRRWTFEPAIDVAACAAYAGE
jgi:hypothetical protein